MRYSSRFLWAAYRGLIRHGKIYGRWYIIRDYVLGWVSLELVEALRYDKLARRKEPRLGTSQCFCLWYFPSYWQCHAELCSDFTVHNSSLSDLILLSVLA